MPVTQTGQFVASRASAFCESQAHARTMAGFGVTPRITVDSSFGCAFYRWGYPDFDWEQYETGGSVDWLTMEGIPSGGRPHTENCYQKVTWQSTYTTPPGGSGTGRTWSVEFYRGYLVDYIFSDTGTAYSWVGNSPDDVTGTAVVPDSKVVSVTAGVSVVITWTWSGTYFDDESVEQPWTETVVLTFDKPFSVEDFCEEAADLFLSITPPASGHQNGWASKDGVPFQEAGNMLYAVINEDMPAASGAGVKLGVISTGENDGTITIVGLRYALTNVQAAYYTRTGDWDNARLSATSEKLPYTSHEYRWVIPKSGDLAGIGSGVAWQACIGTLASYTSPTPDYPEPL